MWANASLLHVARDDLPTVLRRLADVTRTGGLLRIAVKEGDGDGWSTHGAITSPRHFTYWRAAPLGVLVEGAGLGRRRRGPCAGQDAGRVVAHASRGAFLTP